MNERVKVKVNLRVIEDAGWHLTYFLPPHEVQRKLRSFSHIEYVAHDRLMLAVPVALSVNLATLPNTLAPSIGVLCTNPAPTRAPWPCCTLSSFKFTGRARFVGLVRFDRPEYTSLEVISRRIQLGEDLFNRAGAAPLHPTVPPPQLLPFVNLDYVNA